MTKLIVRFVTDHKTGKCWFDEKLGNGQWVGIPETVCACEGNSRHSLEKVVEERRQRGLSINMSKGGEEVIDF